MKINDGKRSKKNTEAFRKKLLIIFGVTTVCIGVTALAFCLASTGAAAAAAASVEAVTTPGAIAIFQAGMALIPALLTEIRPAVAAALLLMGVEDLSNTL